MEKLITEEEIKKRVKELGTEITNDYSGTVPVFIGVLKGVLCFLPDLLRNVSLTVEMDLVNVSFYHGKKKPGIPFLEREITMDIKNRHVILVDDILDTGNTLRFLTQRIKKKKPADLSICILLKKEKQREIEIHADYIGFSIPDKFVVGYGLDYQERFRNLPFLGIMD
ncbi:MAG: hypoxanthine phosphoribosyltransferase [candidate division WOR-3 bacterium]|nr:hypoxanthine phosphoribosyltransferase [candidate division WOR-3 bacterium]